MSTFISYENCNEPVHYMSFDNYKINLGKELYIGTRAGTRMLGRLQNAKFVRVISPFLPAVSNRPDSLFMTILQKIQSNKGLQISFITRKGQSQTEFLEALINAVEGNCDPASLSSAKQQNGFFINLFRQKRKEIPDLRSNRVRGFFMDDYKDDKGKPPYPLHAKVYIIDETDVFLGSYNLTDDGINKNIETSMHITDPIVIKRMINYYNGIVDKCIPSSL